MSIVCILVNLWVHFGQTSTETLLGQEKQFIRFGDLDTIFKVARDIRMSEQLASAESPNKLIDSVQTHMDISLG